jgi:hypothetical protein
MTELSKMTPEIVSPTDTLARLRAPRVFASEKAEDYAALRAALFAELAPRGAYEAALAENLVRYEWEMGRLQHFRDTAILAEFRSLALRALLTGSPTGIIREGSKTEDDHLLIRDLVSLDPQERHDAEKDYVRRCDWDPADLFGLAYARASGVTQMEDRIADLERRRRILRADYMALKAASPHRTVDEAEIVEDAA